MTDPSLPFVTRLWFALACLFRVLFDGGFAARAFAVREAKAALPAGATRVDARGRGRASDVEEADDADRSAPTTISARGKARRAAAAEADAAEGKAAAATAKAAADAKAAAAVAKAVKAAAAEAKAAAEAQAALEAERRLVAPLQLLALLQREGRLVDFLQQDITSFEDAEVGAAARVVHEGCRKALLAHATLEPVRSEEEESRVSVEPGYDPAEVKLTGNVAGKPPYRGVLRHRGWRVRALRLPEPLAGHDFHVVAPAEVEI